MATFPKIIENEEGLNSTADCVAWIKSNVSVLEQGLQDSGVLLFRGFPIDSVETFDHFVHAFDYPIFTYQESLSNAVRVNHTPRVFTANEAPKNVEIFLHHEMAQTPISPEKLFFFCLSAAEQGGATPVCRSDLLYADLKQNYPAIAADFEKRGLRYKTNMPEENNPDSGQGRSWKSTLTVDNREQAEQKLQNLGYRWQWSDDNSLSACTPVLPAVITLDDGSQSFYNQVVAAYMGWQGVRENPSKALTFGDDTEIPVDYLETIVTVSAKYTVDLDWQDGDIALIDNKRTMHGRRPYDGERKRQVFVALSTASG